MHLLKWVKMVEQELVVLIEKFEDIIDAKARFSSLVLDNNNYHSIKLYNDKNEVVMMHDGKNLPEYY